VLKVGGFTPFTTIDYPGKLAAVVFCQGCPWRCGYCHNRELLDAAAPGVISWDEVLSFLERRRGLLDAVVFSGGEPTMQPGLKEAVIAVRGMGFLIGLHTAGAFPEMLKELLPYLDWVGMDLKAPFSGYERITGVPDSGKAAERSARLVRDSGVRHCFRTTLHPWLESEGRMEELAGMVKDWGSDLMPQRLHQHGGTGLAMSGADSA